MATSAGQSMPHLSNSLMRAPSSVCQLEEVCRPYGLLLLLRVVAGRSRMWVACWGAKPTFCSWM
jgi:hypothetical protein